MSLCGARPIHTIDSGGLDVTVEPGRMGGGRQNIYATMRRSEVIVGLTVRTGRRVRCDVDGVARLGLMWRHCDSSVSLLAVSFLYYRLDFLTNF